MVPINKLKVEQIFLDKRIRVVASCGGEEFPPALNEIYISIEKFNQNCRY